MASYTVPGVYVEEPAGLSLSVQTGETAVPVFAYVKPAEPVGKVFTGAGIIPFSSWLDVTSAMVKENITDDEKKKFDTDPLYQSLKLYFANGGGHCYIAPVDQLGVLVPTLDDVTLLVQAGTGAEDPTTFTTFITQVNKLCQTGYPYFAIFDGPKSAPVDKTSVTSAQEKYTLAETASPYAAVYHPWLKLKETDPDSGVIPPSGAVAGAYARTDRERGVWKAPANVAISGAVPAVKISDEIDGYCNAPDSGGKSINVIREFRGTGPLIWGARTLKSDDPHWKFVPVRRLFSAVEKDIKTAMSAAMFEPNSQPTWEQVRSAVESYLYGLWKQGALLGETPEQAYRVLIGAGITMTPKDINDGIMRLSVALAAVRPAEFIVLELSQMVVPG